jgi:predicted permease
MSWVNRLLGSLRKNKFEDQLDDELQFHLDMRTQEFVAAGMKPDEARRQALRLFGNQLLLKERTRDMDTIAWLETIWRDVRYGRRMLRRSPGFTAVAALSLALGIGANTAIFSLIDSVMLKTLPVESPDQLVSLSRNSPGGEGESFTYPVFEQFRGASELFSSVFGFAYRSVGVRTTGAPEAAVAQLVSGDYFHALGIAPVVGRAIVPEDDQPLVGQPVAVISYRFWKQRFALDPAVGGKSLIVNSVPLTIVGVMPRDFFGTSLDYAADLWVPINMQPQIDGGTSRSSLSATGINWVVVMARLRPGVSHDRAQNGANVIFQRFLSSVRPGSTEGHERILLEAGGRPVSALRSAVSAPLVILMAIVGLVLLLTCANLANLLLARGLSRQREITIRLSIGAGRLRLLRQLLTESLLLAALGGGSAMVFAAWGIRLLLDFVARAVSHPLPAPLQFHLDVRVLLFTGLVSLLSGVLFGLAPALRATGVSLISGLKEIPSGGLSPRLRLNQSLLVAQVAICLPLLFAGSLFMRSFQKLASVTLGFEPNGVVQIRSVVFGPSYTEGHLSGTWNLMLERIRETPGTVSVSMSQPGLFSHSTSQSAIIVDGHTSLIHTVAVTPGFFRTLHIPFVTGRDFSILDRTTPPQVAIINEALARRFLHGLSPLGQRILTGVGPDKLEVVGVVQDTKYDSLLAEAPPILYSPLAPAFLPNFRVFEVRTAGDTAAAASTLRRVVQSVDPDLPADILPMNEFIGQSLVVQRFVAHITGFFAVTALLLAAVGLYGLTSYLVTRRTNEIGIRIAMGADPRDVVWMMMRQAITLVLIGSLVGLAVSVVAGPLVGSQLFGLTATDPMSLFEATALLLSVAAVAGYLPARRASRVDPMVALRYE